MERNGCSRHSDCLTCPFPECRRGKRASRFSPEEKAKRSNEQSLAYYYRNREKILNKIAEKRGGRRLQVEHEKRMELYNQGLTDGVIADMLGYKRLTLWAWRKKNGLPPNFGPRSRKEIVSE